MTTTTSPVVAPSAAGPPATAAPKLLDQVRAVARSRRYGAHTEALFAEWTRRFVMFHGKRHPAQMAEPEVVRFLTHLAVQEHVSLSIQSQARAALVFLYRHVLQRPLGRLEGVIRGERPSRPRTPAAAGAGRPPAQPKDGRVASQAGQSTKT